MLGRLPSKLQQIWRELESRREEKPNGLVPPTVMLTAALILLFQQVWGNCNTFEHLFARYAAWRWFELGSFVWWTCSKLVGYIAVPMIVLWRLGLPLSDLGWSTHGLGSHAKIYVTMFLLVLPAVIVASGTLPFLSTYPFYRLAYRSWPDLLIWEGCYALSFLALEVFFRGFMLFPLQRAFGGHAIWIMVIPYCMIHFQKPAAEALGAVGAGVVLGGLALWTRSIWSGVLIHVAVAWTMDLLALSKGNGFPSLH